MRVRLSHFAQTRYRWECSYYDTFRRGPRGRTVGPNSQPSQPTADNSFLLPYFDRTFRDSLFVTKPRSTFCGPQDSLPGNWITGILFG